MEFIDKLIIVLMVVFWGLYLAFLNYKANKT